ncbi:hypothetical protein PHSY_001344 [Pseudozyma hubeiensis SY62]|uniref:Protein YOP1 n=1 Tax=Pseudozyma hubeiensis (strain SY62) TaxID=1305764 RepID=R9NYJ5_PSEHS|nr:hypothetical protein PHSY_001344 [Pseudozyma hubeiensis SY62]GAC93779.1 hypothetical protein PHSY_001344 [Pseudozyma hubeiensis SY62]
MAARRRCCIGEIMLWFAFLEPPNHHCADEKQDEKTPGYFEKGKKMCIDKELSRYPALKKFEQTVPIPKAYAAIGAFGIFTLFVFFNIAAGFLTNLIGFFIPAYFSLKALESPQPQDDIQWLTYWVVFGMFTFLETFSSIVLYYVPWYYTIKTLAIVWLMLPQTQGAKMVYSKVIRPAFLTTQKTVHQANASTPAAPAETH